MKRLRDQTWRSASLALIALLLTISAAPAAEAQEVPYDGIVVEANVPVRAGAGRSLYVVGELPRNTTVRVEEVIFGWLKIIPPEGVHSYISKAFVDARGDGSTGEVNANRTRVVAASLDGPGTSYREQTLLSRGTTVRIVDEEGSFYKIEPPAGTYVFLPPGSVRRASDMQAATQPDGAPDTETEPEPTTEPAPEPEPESADAEPDAPAETTLDEQVSDEQADDESADDASSADADDERESEPAVDEVADRDDSESEVSERPEIVAEDVDTPAISDALRAVEQRHLPAFNLPLEDQPFDRMIADYQRVKDENGNLPTADQRILEHRLAALERNQRLAASLIRMAELREQTEQTDRELAQGRRAREASPSYYDAVGELLASTVYDGQNLPRLFRLVDQDTGRTIGYIAPSDEFEPRDMLGQTIGIIGETHLDPNLRLRMFDVRQIDRIEPNNDQ